jgi:hypothetical protein
MSEARMPKVAQPAAPDDLVSFELPEHHHVLLTRAIQRDLDATISFAASLRHHGAPEIADRCDEEVTVLLEIAEAFDLPVHVGDA